MAGKSGLARSGAAAVRTARAVAPAPVPVVSAIIPCLNEERRSASASPRRSTPLPGAGSRARWWSATTGRPTDRSRLPKALGARVVHQPVKGYGAAISAAAGAARGKYLIMADADDSYDWGQLDEFIDALEAGAELVMGNRFAGGIEAGAMPPLHRYLGNPVLSAVARWLHRSPIRDFHCGMRGFTRDAFGKMGARSPGMEFASRDGDQRASRRARHPRGADQALPRQARPPAASALVPRRLAAPAADHRPCARHHVPDSRPGAARRGRVRPRRAGATARCLIGGHYFGIHFVALSSMATLIGLSAILLGALAKVAIAIYHPTNAGAWCRGSSAAARSNGWSPAAGCSLPGGLAADALLAFKWIFVGGPMEQSVHLVFAITTATVAGVMMVLSGFVLKLLLDNLDDRHGF